MEFGGKHLWSQRRRRKRIKKGGGRLQADRTSEQDEGIISAIINVTTTTANHMFIYIQPVDI